MKVILGVCMSFFLAQSLGAAETKVAAKSTQRKPAAASGQFFCNLVSGDSTNLESDMKEVCNTRLPFSFAAAQRVGVTTFTYCCTAK